MLGRSKTSLTVKPVPSGPQSIAYGALGALALEASLLEAAIAILLATGLGAVMTDLATHRGAQQGAMGSVKNLGQFAALVRREPG